MDHATGLLAGLVTLADDHHGVVGTGREGHRAADGLGPVGDLVDVDRAAVALPLLLPPCALEHGGPDTGRVLRARVVVGDDHNVGLPHGGRTHRSPLGPVAVAASPQHDDEPAGGV